MTMKTAPMKMTLPKATILLALLPLSVFATAKPVSGEQPELKAALEKHLKSQGLVCLGKFEWPVEVNANDLAAGTRDSIQMPVLEKLGVVKSTKTITKTDEAPDGIEGRRYNMTDAGLHYYLAKDTVIVGGVKVSDERRDLCPVHLNLDKITRVVPKSESETQDVVVSYTYKVDAPEWIRDPDARKVFPMIDRIVNGAGNLQLQQHMTSDGKTWTAQAPGAE